jgi:hypothetical protein
LAAASTLTLLAGLLVLALPSTPALASTAAAPACTTGNLDVWLNTMGTTGNLDVWLNTMGNGAAGSSYYNLNFTNPSAHSCTLYGYPGVSGVTQAGIQLGSSAGRDAEHAPSVITLTSAKTARGFNNDTPRSSATVVLQITVAENFPTSMCAPVTAAGLRVYPPGQKESTVVPFPYVACGNAGPRYLHVESVQKYVTGQ